jgi:hypothetical protein
VTYWTNKPAFTWRPKEIREHFSQPSWYLRRVCGHLLITSQVLLLGATELVSLPVTLIFIFYHGAKPQWAKASSLSRIHDQTQTHYNR